MQRKGHLYLIPMVISEDTEGDTISPAVRRIVNELDFFLVENVRTARRYLSKLKIQKPIDTLHFEVLDKNTDKVDLSIMMKPILAGSHMGVISESGCPGIADPGAHAVDWAHQHDVRVIPLVGPSSILLALMASGLNGQRFAFHGYLPIKSDLRIKEIKKLEKVSMERNETQIFIETPYRNNQLLTDLVKACQPQTRICVARDISGKSERIHTQTASSWQKTMPDLHKIPVVFLLHS